MAVIVVYDSSGRDDSSFLDLLADHDVRMVEDQLRVETVDEDAEVIAVFVSSQVTDDLLKEMPKLKLIACRSTGYNNIDLNSAKRRGITVCNVPTYGEHTVAEYAFTLLLALTRKLPQVIENTEDGDELGEVCGTDLFGKTLGVVGTGKIGRQVARIGNGFGMKVVAYDINSNPDQAKEYCYQEVGLDELLESSDVVSLHVPYVKENHHLLNESRLHMMKEGSLLVNTARGELVDSTALIKALQNGPLAGAGLDVLEGEQLLDREEELVLLRSGTLDNQTLKHSLEISILQHLPNVVLTNHNAYNSKEAIGRINSQTADNILSYLKGEPKNTIS